MAISVTNIGAATNSGGASVAITPATVPAGACIIIGIDEDTSSTTAGTVADTKNTYTAYNATLLHPNAVQANGLGMLYYSNAVLALSAGTITYTKVTSGNKASASAFYVTGLATGDPRDSGVFAHATGSSTTPSVTSNAASVAGDLFVALLCSNANITFTQDTTHGWATPFVLSAVALASVAGGNQVNAGTSAITFAPTISTGAWDAAIYGFLALPVANNPFLQTSWPTPPRVQPIVAVNSQNWPQGNPPTGFVPPAYQPDGWLPLRPDPRVAVNAQAWTLGEVPSSIPQPPVTTVPVPLDWTSYPYQARRAALEPVGGRLPSGFTPPIQQLDWPDPLRTDPRTALNALVQGNPPTGFKPPVQQLDWPNALRPQPIAALSARSFGNPPSAFTPPVQQTDWPVPLRPDPRVAENAQDWPVGNPPTGFTPPVQQTDWPDPTRPDARVAANAQSWLWDTNPPTGAPVQPPKALDWPNPARAGPRTDQQLGNPPRSFTPPVPSVDWINPQRLAPRISFELGAPPRSVALPVANSDWPLPVRPARRFDHLGLSFRFQTTPPLSQFDWRNPRAPERRTTDLGLQRLASIITIVRPPTVVDWPLQRRRPQFTEWWNQVPASGIIPPPTPPFEPISLAAFGLITEASLTFFGTVAVSTLVKFGRVSPEEPMAGTLSTREVTTDGTLASNSVPAEAWLIATMADAVTLNPGPYQEPSAMAKTDIALEVYFP